MAQTARAFWVRAPGVGEIRAATVPEPAPDEVLVRTAAHGRQPRHRDAGVPGRSAAEPARHDARAVPGGRVPGPGQVRVPQRRGRRGRPGEPTGPHRLLPLPAPDGVRRAGRRRLGRAARTCRPPGPCSRGRWRPPSMRSGTRRRCRRPDRGGRSRHGRLRGGPTARPLPRRRRDPRRRGRRQGRGRRPVGRRRSRRRRTPPAAATSSCTPARRPPACSVRSSCSPRRAQCWSSPGTATTRCGSRSAGSSTPAGSTIRASQVGRVSPARRDRRSTADRLELALRAAAGSGVRRPSHGRIRLRRASRAAAPARLGRARGAVPHHHVRRNHVRRKHVRRNHSRRR